MGQKEVEVGRYVFKEPATIEDAIARKRKLEAEVHDISFQLTDPIRRDKRGRVLSPAEYKEWARNAKAARLHREAEIRFLKDWIAAARLDARRRNLGAGDTDRDLLVRMHEVLTDILKDADVAMLAPEHAGPLCDLVRQHLQAV